jgi:hypothetical protein
MFETPNAEILKEIDVSVILSALKQTRSKSVSKQKQEIIETFKKSTNEMEKHPDIAVSLNKVKVLRDHDWGTGEFYLLSYILDSNGVTEYKSPLFQGIRDGDYLPLGEGGMLAHYKKNPGLFVDIHGIVMESDSDVRELGKRIQEAKEKVKFDEITKIATTLSTVDPTKITTIMTGVNLFLDALVMVLQKNNDDHAGTFHDFYLKQQAFGVGRHPKTGLKRCQDIELAYTINYLDS